MRECVCYVVLIHAKCAFYFDITIAFAYATPFAPSVTTVRGSPTPAIPQNAIFSRLPRLDSYNSKSSNSEPVDSELALASAEAKPSRALKDSMSII